MNGHRDTKDAAYGPQENELIAEWIARGEQSPH
jgi:hypothetical protein